MALHVLGVRHHSPSCARLVEAAIRAIRPRHVLVEGPCDLNDRLEELLLPHVLPVAVFTYYRNAGENHASWTPFCRHSPEWVALQTAREIGAQARFMDLPAWSEAFHGHANRYADRTDRTPRTMSALCRRLGVDDSDSLWDHLFEQPQPLEELAEALRIYFEELRGDDPPDAMDEPREEFMADALAWAVADAERTGEDVVAVCGGYHAPALSRRAAERREHSPVRFPTPPEPEPGAKAGSYLVPYSFRRLDSFVGYESGLPSPFFYDVTWELGPEAAAEKMLEATARRLRERKQPVSPADLIAASTLAQGLARMRGHRCLLRQDLLDGLAGALVKDGLDAPLPWSYRGTLRAGTDPVLVEVVAAFSGDHAGRLAVGTPRPPLLHDVQAVLEQKGLTPPADARDRRIAKLDLTLEDHRLRSRILHRLRVLEIPGFVRQSGPTWATDVELSESWELSRPDTAESALIEASSWGASLESAAAARLGSAIGNAAGKLAALASLLGEAVFVGIESLSDSLLPKIAEGARQETSFGELGGATARLLALWRHGSLLGAEGAAAISSALGAAFERGLWLVEGIQGATAPTDEKHLAAIVALKDLLRFGSEPLALSRPSAAAVMLRRAADAEAPPAIRGAAIGFLWNLGLVDAADGEERARRVLFSTSRPSTFGDCLAGLFALAREECAAATGIVAAIDAALTGMGQEEFLVALPSVRHAFSYFPPMEKDSLGRTVASFHGAGPEEAQGLLRLSAGASETARALRLEDEVSRIVERFGLGGRK
ncbi:MAG: hypothetical protein IPN83_01860 [Holophagales bacterium]|nr:hypothetical protein [Holophagales bacterium]